MQLTREHRQIVIDFLKNNGQSSSWSIGLKLGICTRKALQFMKLLASHGDVQLCDRYSSVNNCVWKLTDKAKAGN